MVIRLVSQAFDNTETDEIDLAWVEQSMANQHLSLLNADDVKD